jgi:hypothetical protein
MDDTADQCQEVCNSDSRDQRIFFKLVPDAPVSRNILKVIPEIYGYIELMTTHRQSGLVCRTSSEQGEVTRNGTGAEISSPWSIFLSGMSSTHLNPRQVVNSFRICRP